jgi:glycosyltransferase involved in cell wall biosynthesis
VKRVPLGINPPKQSNVYNDDTTYFIYSGSVMLRKGIQYLLSAWDSLDLPNTELIVTSNVDESAQSIVEEFNDTEDIHFVGWVDDLYEQFGKSSLFVFPSLEDGFGMVVIEAMASGLPVIVSENTGAKDCVREGVDGQVVPIRDSEALAEAMQYMYDNPEERKQMGENAQAYIRSNFTEDDYGERIFSKYQAMISQ